MRYLGVPFVELLPKTAGWMEDGSAVAPRTWLMTVGRYQEAIAYGELFWPQFVERQGRVYLSDPGASNDDLPDEELHNHRHIVDILRSDVGTHEQVRYIGKLLQDMWSAKLARDFPGRRFVVDFPDEPCDSVLDYIITFWEERDPPDKAIAASPPT